VIHRRPGKQHLNGHMSTAHKKRLRHVKEVGRAQIPLVKGCPPYLKAKIR